MLSDFMNDLNGGFQGAGMGASLLGGMQTAKIAGASNPWVAGGILAGGAILGGLNANDPAKRRAAKLNDQMGQQELEMGGLNINAAKNQQAAETARRRTWEQFGGMFSRYMAGMAGGPRGI